MTCWNVWRSKGWASGSNRSIFRRGSSTTGGVWRTSAAQGETVSWLRTRSTHTRAPLCERRKNHCVCACSHPTAADVPLACLSLAPLGSAPCHFDERQCACGFTTQLLRSWLMATRWSDLRLPLSRGLAGSLGMPVLTRFAAKVQRHKHTHPPTHPPTPSFTGHGRHTSLAG
jgi:hypothetical protein